MAKQGEALIIYIEAHSKGLLFTNAVAAMLSFATLLYMSLPIIEFDASDETMEV